MWIWALIAAIAAGQDVAQAERVRLQAWDILLKLSVRRELAWMLMRPDRLEEWASRLSPAVAREVMQGARAFRRPGEVFEPWFRRNLRRGHLSTEAAPDLAMDTLLELSALPIEEVTWEVATRIARERYNLEVRHERGRTELGAWEAERLAPYMPEVISPPDPGREMPEDLEALARFFIDRTSLEELAAELGLSTQEACRELLPRTSRLVSEAGFDAPLEDNRLLWACHLDRIDRAALSRSHGGRGQYLTQPQYDLVDYEVRGLSPQEIQRLRDWAWLNSTRLRDRTAHAKQKMRQEIERMDAGLARTRSLEEQRQRHLQARQAYELKAAGLTWTEARGRLQLSPKVSMATLARAHALREGLAWPPGSDRLE